MDLLEKIVNCIRISPHGILLTGLDAGLIAGTALNPGFYYNLSASLRCLYGSVAGGLFGSSLPFLITGIENYKEYKEFIERNGIVARHIKRRVRLYCNRQAYKAAAYSCGLGDEFDEINKQVPLEMKKWNWVPEV